MVITKRSTRPGESEAEVEEKSPSEKRNQENQCGLIIYIDAEVPNNDDRNSREEGRGLASYPSVNKREQLRCP